MDSVLILSPAYVAFAADHDICEGVVTPRTAHVRDFLVQRQRWLWGDIHAIRHRKALPLGSAVAVAGKYAAGVPDTPRLPRCAFCAAKSGVVDLKPVGRGGGDRLQVVRVGADD
jgi:hypothetical protein